MIFNTFNFSHSGPYIHIHTYYVIYNIVHYIAFSFSLSRWLNCEGNTILCSFHSHTETLLCYKYVKVDNYIVYISNTPPAATKRRTSSWPHRLLLKFVKVKLSILSRVYTPKCRTHNYQNFLFINLSAKTMHVTGYGDSST